jgi:RAT1-interacting protein
VWRSPCKQTLAAAWTKLHCSKTHLKGEADDEIQEFTCFSYDDQHKLHLDERSLKWYYPPLELGTDLSNGFEKFDKHDDSQDEHLDSLLEAIIKYEKETGKPIDAHVVTWRGMMTKVRMLKTDRKEVTNN